MRAASMRRRAHFDVKAKTGTTEDVGRTAEGGSCQEFTNSLTGNSKENEGNKERDYFGRTNPNKFGQLERSALTDGSSERGYKVSAVPGFRCDIWSTRRCLASCATCWRHYGMVYGGSGGLMEEGGGRPLLIRCKPV